MWKIKSQGVMDTSIDKLKKYRTRRPDMAKKRKMYPAGHGYRRWFSNLLRRQSSGGCWFNPDFRRVTRQEHLYPVVEVMANEIRTGDPVDSLKDEVQSSMKFLEFNKLLKKAGGHIDRNVVEITIKLKTIVRKPLMIKITKFCLRN